MLRILVRLYLITIIAFSAAIYLIPDLVIKVFHERFLDYNLDQSRGLQSLIVKQFRALPAQQWPTLVKEMDEEFHPLQVALVRIDDPDFSDYERERLQRGEKVVRLGDWGWRTLAVSPLDEQLAVKLVVPPDPLDVNLLYWSINVLIVAVLLACLLLWVRPHWRDLERLRLAAERFGDNELGTRLHLSRRSNIRDLAQHFNRMAARIEGLIANQRELTNAVSHELRTPIARLSFELDQLQQQPDPDENRELIADMYADLGELEEMVSELLSYASLEHGAATLNRENIQAQSWLDSVVGSVALEAEAAGVQLLIRSCQVEYVRIEPRFMARAVINLLRNAIRYADRRVEVSLVRLEHGYEVRVNDDGPGVPVDGREKIFEPFSRLDASRDRRTGGFGLGLALVRRVSQWHGGKVEVADSEWGGASFRMTWAHLD